RRREAAQVELRERICDDAQILTLRTAGKDTGDRSHVLGEPAHVGTAQEKHSHWRAGRDLIGRPRGQDPPIRKEGDVRAPLRLDEVVGAYDHARPASRQPFHTPPYLL